MKSVIVFLFYFFITFLYSESYSATIAYCKGSNITKSEGSVLQHLVTKFANKMKCSAGNNCLNKWTGRDKVTKFSIAWKKQCGPVINGAYQLGDEGKGSTFVCETKADNNKTCCWPLGYKYVKYFVMCISSSRG